MSTITAPSWIHIMGACEHNLKNIDVKIPRNSITVITGVSGSGKSSLAFDTLLSESQRRFFYTLSHYTRQFLDLGSRPNVRRITGLSPSIALSQNETQPSSRATVATLTDLGELLGVLYARFGKKVCPTHKKPTASMSLDDMIARLQEWAPGETIAVTSPVAEKKKGVFRKELTGFAEKGFLKVFCDGDVLSLTPPPKLEREEKHTIKLIVDYLKVPANAKDSIQRLKASLETALIYGEGFVECFLAQKSGAIDLKSIIRFSAAGGCPDCGFSWPSLDPRYFSANSLGRCTECDGFGSEEEDLSLSCPECLGSGLHPQYQAITIAGTGIGSHFLKNIGELDLFLREFKDQALLKNQAFLRVKDEILGITGRLMMLGLEYLHLSRRIRSLSGGESQRLRLAGILSKNLKGVLYILDEPSQGLHPKELDKIFENLLKLKDLGNTVVIVDHDELLMRRADWVIDLGPGGGAKGGSVVAQFKPDEVHLFAEVSQTARYLCKPENVEDLTGWQKGVQPSQTFLTITKPRLHNLKLKEVSFQLNAFNVVTGVSGAGKTSLVFHTLYPNVVEILEQGPKAKALFCESVKGAQNLEMIEVIDRRPVAKSSVSMPATYLDVFTELRKLYHSLPEAQIAGLTARDFSLAADQGGRCDECKGRGEIVLSMRFLQDARILCAACGGKRYKPEVLSVKLKGLSLADCLELTIDQATEFFTNHSIIRKRLMPAVEMGLGYLKLGQTTASLSGGEAQRLKLVPILAKARSSGHVLILDEPTQGLHFADVELLLKSLKKVVSQGATLIVIEHNQDLINKADWLVELGPGSGATGGQLLRQGRRRS